MISKPSLFSGGGQSYRTKQIDSVAKKLKPERFFTHQPQHNINSEKCNLFAEFKFHSLQNNLLHHVMCMLHPG
jgi:hypothetical protein